MKLQIYTFGGVRFVQEGQPMVRVGSRKMRALFLYLVLRQQPATREELIELLWSHMSPERAAANLRRELTGLRKVFGKYVTISADGIALKQETAVSAGSGQAVWVDAFHLDKTQQSLTSRPLNGRSAARLESLLNDIYQGDFLAGFQVRGAEYFNRWLHLERERWQQVVVTTLELLVLFTLSQQVVAYDKGIAYLHQLLQLDPLREAAHRQLMQLLAASNRRSEALKQYEICRKLLWEELGVTPDAATEALFATIYDGHSVDMPLPKTAVIPHALPTPITPFVGREAELEQLATLLANSSTRLITILGPGGMGKTRLALAAAQTQLERSTVSTGLAFADGVYFVPLARVQTIDGIVPAIAQTLDLKVDNSRPLQRQLITFLRRKRMLLVLDNIEHLLEMASLVNELLQAAPHLCLLLTSRQWLNHQAEHLLLLEGMAFPPPENPAEPQRDELATLELFESVQLFLQAARPLQPQLTLTDANQDDISHICRLSAGLPLGIVLAASWLDVLTLPEILVEMRRSLDFLATEMADLPARQRSLRAAFLASWRLLTPRQQELLPQLAFFQGGFTLEAAQAVTGTTPMDLRQLLHKSLLSRGKNGRFEIHELVRQFAAEKLGEMGEASLASRHAAYFCRKLIEWTPLLRGPKQQPTVLAIEADIDNILLTWHVGVQQQDPDDLLVSFESFEVYCSWRKRQEAFVNVLFPALEHYKKAETPQQKRLLVLLHNFAAVYSHDSQRHLAAAAALLAELEATGIDVRQQKAQNLMFRGVLSANFSDQVQFHEQSLAIYRAVGEPWRIGIVLIAISTATSFACDVARSESAIQEAYKIFTTLENPRALATVHELIVNNSRLLCTPEEMVSLEQHARRCYELRKELGQATFDVSAMIQTSFTLIVQGRYDEMLSFVERGLAQVQVHGYETNVMQTAILAWHLIHVGQYERIQTLAERLLPLCHRAYVKGWWWAALAEAVLAQGKMETARRFYKNGFACLRENAELKGEIRYGSGWVMAQGTLAALKYKVEQNVSLKTRGLWYRLPATAAFVFLQQGEPERAIEYYTVSARYPGITKSCWWQDMVGKRVAAAKRALPAAVVAKAEAKGREMDVETAVKSLAT